MLALAAALQNSAIAQPVKPYSLPKLAKDSSSFLIFKGVSAGPYFTAGESRQNEDLPQTPSAEWHCSPRLAYTFGGTIDFSINQWIGIDFSALYDARELYLATASDTEYEDLNVGYVSILPSIRLFWLLVGLTFDIPMSGSATLDLPHYTATGQAYKENMNIPTSDLNLLTEARATLSIPVLEGDGATLHVIVSGTYPLSKLLASSTPSFDTTARQGGVSYFSHGAAPGQGPLPTLEAGISYQFDLLH